MDIKVVGIDLAKNSFQVCVQLQDNSIAWNRKVTRAKLLDTLRQFPNGTLIAMEACNTSTYWGRTFRDMGYQIKLLPAQHVKPLVGRQKNDARDAMAICEAAFRPKIHPVAIKTLEQQDIKILRGVRRRLVEHRTATMNQIRAIAGEYGVIFTKGVKNLQEELPEALEADDNGLTPVARQLLAGLRDDIKFLNQDIDDLEQQLCQLCQRQPRYQTLLSIPGFGPIVAAAFLSEVGNGEQFKNGRQVSAWCGLVPKQYGTGGKVTLKGITKTGDRDLRTLLVHGARAIAACHCNRADPLGRWVKGLIERRGFSKAVVAMANKMARIAWKIVRSGDSYDMVRAFGVTTTA